MAVGDTFSALQSVNSGAFLDVQPSGTIEAVIHNIYHAASVTISYYDGANDLAFDTMSGSGVYAHYCFHCTNARRIRIKNNDAAPQLIGYDGIITHA